MWLILYMTDHAPPMKLEKHYTCWIERRWHISGSQVNKKTPCQALQSTSLSLSKIADAKIFNFEEWGLARPVIAPCISFLEVHNYCAQGMTFEICS